MHVPLAGVAVKRMSRWAEADVGYPFPVVAIVAGIVSWPGKVGYFVVDETSCCQRIHQLVELRGSLLFLHRQLPALADECCERRARFHSHGVGRNVGDTRIYQMTDIGMPFRIGKERRPINQIGRDVRVASVLYQLDSNLIFQSTVRPVDRKSTRLNSSH